MLLLPQKLSISSIVDALWKGTLQISVVVAFYFVWESLEAPPDHPYPDGDGDDDGDDRHPTTWSHLTLKADALLAASSPPHIRSFEASLSKIQKRKTYIKYLNMNINTYPFTSIPENGGVVLIILTQRSCMNTQHKWRKIGLNDISRQKIHHKRETCWDLRRR